MVLISKAHRRAVFEYIIGEGVIVVKKDAYLPRHQHVTSVPNIVVMMIVKSLKSRRYLNGVFNWQWSYYMLNDAGVKYICEFLGLPEDVVPATYKKVKMARANADEDEKKEGAEDSETKGKDEETAAPAEVRA
mmetsp:Transcript_30225/g.26784  ORF Transcript_30225/g.26784 Transcript_30225/m.26784 type:complete len:133 (+) Transcript_30225:30-428(+)